VHALQARYKSIGVAFADLTVTAQGKLALSTNGTSAESVFHEDVVAPLASLLREWVRAKAGVDRKAEDSASIRRPSIGTAPPLLIALCTLGLNGMLGLPKCSAQTTSYP
jgi:hypothetical protein